MTRETWDVREVPILEAVADYEDEHGKAVPNLETLIDLTGLDETRCTIGVRALIAADPPFLHAHEMSSMGGWGALNIGLAERVRRWVGQWPSDNPADELLALLAERAGSAPTDDERSRWATAAEVLKALPGKALTEVTIALIKRQAGL